MNKVLILLALVALTLAKPPGHRNHKHEEEEEEENGNGNGKGHGAGGKGGDAHASSKPTEPLPVALERKGFAHNEELAFYDFEGMKFLVAGAQTRFVIVNQQGACVTVDADEDQATACMRFNQTICDEISANPCTPAVANLTCSDPQTGAELAAAMHSQVANGHGYQYGGPLCHVVVAGKKVQAHADSNFGFVSANTIKSCHIDVAPAPTTAPVQH